MGARRRVAAATVASALVVTSVGGVLAASPAAAKKVDQEYWIAANKKIALTGHGYGHGHGMSQHGAQGAALQGLGYKQILGFYYPGTTMGKMKGKVRVLISDDTSPDVVVSPAKGLAVRDLADGTTHELPTTDGVTRWRINVTKNGRTVVAYFKKRWRRFKEPWARSISGDAEFHAKEPMQLWMPSGKRTYRGILRAASPSPGSNTRDTVNIVTMDQYVMGVVPYEMPASWHPEAVKAQAVAARTYATWSRNQNRRRHYQICDTTACQVYKGADGEDRRSNEAVRATRREILRHQGAPAFSQFSASSGGWTARGSQSYLPAKKDPYDGWSGNTVHTWTKTVDGTLLERKYPSIGKLRRIRVTNRDGNGQWRGRVVSMVLDGTKGNVTISGDSFRWAFGLRSNWFTIKPTPITRRWARIGAVDSRIGKPRSRQWKIAHGSNQLFKRGRIFYSKRTGAKELYGPVLHAYNRFGGPRSKLGFPRTPIRKRGANGRRHLARFENGGIYYKRPKKPVVVTGPIERRYFKAGGLNSGLGWPKRGNYKVRNGERVNFYRGYMVWNKKTGKVRIVRRK